ncbi:sigma-54-dependent transcriptional regulator [Marinobacterium jannaschii]|uniref:sigma-54-dependent transcriptional regulator n=1 Tax=Marinobacterium jannaschii TaxID=64970 RepID=UPI000AEE240E|nr:sigma-54 dependent transcriptional regulator [Marinobacterium jannaschii]
MAKRSLEVLLVDDDVAVLNALERVLRALPLRITRFSDPREALARCRQQQFQVVLSDQRMPWMQGTELLQEIARLQPDSTRLILSGYADFDQIIAAFNQGTIQQFLQKPWDDQQLISLLNKLCSERLPSSSEEEAQLFNGMLSGDAVMQNLFCQIPRIALANAPVFIHGETGTGKELVARAIHAESTRSEGPFVAVNCANFSEQLMEAELFGHKKGAFTSATADRDGLLSEADGGTLFLDEVTTLPMPLQAKLLRVLQERNFRPVGSNRVVSFDAQIVSASSTALAEAVAQGNFRSDLQYRLGVLPLQLPPLCQRGDDPVRLLMLFLQQLDPKRQFRLSEGMAACLLQHRWPGNVRELYNLAQYLCAMTDSELLQRHMLPEYWSQDVIAADAVSGLPHKIQLDLQKLEAEQLEALLNEHENNRSALARTLGVSRMSLWRRMKALQLS